MDSDQQQAPALDYATLRQDAIAHLERMAGGGWTDFNAHDPGITLLESLCYALTDFGYRSWFDVPDLLASGGADPFESLFGPAEILPGGPVTLDDLRKLILDVDGVKNAWIESDHPELPLYHDAESQELGHLAVPPVSEPVELRGLHRVLVETLEYTDLDGPAIRAAVIRRLYANRSLCQDFTEVVVLEDKQKIQVNSALEIGGVEDAEAVLVQVFDAIADHLSPPVPFLTLDEMVQRGHSIDEIFDGPLLDNGFIEPQSLERSTRRSQVNTSDLIHVVMDVPGVRAVSWISVSDGAGTQPWALEIDATQAARLDIGNSEIKLERAGIDLGVDLDRVHKAYAQRRRAASRPQRSGRPTDGGGMANGLVDAADSLTPQRGRDRSVGRYRSARRDLPALYGVGELGLAASAGPERRARAKQLKAYLLFFDQLLANSFAQLENVRRLFANEDDELQTYFSQVVDEPELDAVVVGDVAERLQRLAAITDSVETTNHAAEGGVGGALERKNRFLNHLLARFGEDFTDYSLVLFDSGGATSSPPEKLIGDKQAFLGQYPQISGRRGMARNDLDSAHGSNTAGLENRVRLKLGLDTTKGEDLLLVEHILLRPMRDDVMQAEPLLAAARRQDPYSLQLSFVFPDSGRLSRTAFQRFAEQTVREETPAHVTPYLQWLDTGAFLELQGVYAEWLEQRRDFLAAGVGVAAGRLVGDAGG